RSGRCGTAEEPVNDSKGCGGVMRVAPAGLVNDADAFRLGCEAGAVTHGHPTGWLSAGALACMVRQLVEGDSIERGVKMALGRLRHVPGHEETTAALDAALRLHGSAAPTPELVESLGGGWIAEEALAIGVYCALAADGDFAAGVRLAVNHSGDSDSTGAIAGNLLGALLGADAIPARWLERLELRDEMTAMADDLLTSWSDGPEWWARYPGV
ncbi:MAG TPA: ADP-ribosylglycohydrolase family protein, partial [Gemmatimonadaceae bacterium]|nr:ADP-ribosylglycohydrolase family protein [Gemmatimonadaceae bacterium]